ncbi:hypothetical protein AAH979_31735 [Plantactinospora sp. ZYX-F-223]|uniref:hypothetical protein n=1 Tax=Plantactinospora sp. ZYX-F-223 TaxID=3144103 RepID=UPI0031FD8197
MVFLNLARVDSAVILKDATIDDGRGPALTGRPPGPSLVAAGVNLRRGFRAGFVDPYGATVAGPLDLTGARLSQPAATALPVRVATVAGDFTADTDTEVAGTMDLTPAKGWSPTPDLRAGDAAGGLAYIGHTA